MTHAALLQRAAEVVASAEALVIGAGAGMGVDSGLPDFRGAQGFWNAYPPYRQLGLDFIALANPRWFHADPALAWGFYGHRLNLYRATTPHAGFHVLRSWAQRLPHGAFVFTSNVDGHFQRAGFDPDRVIEVHGSLDWMQCTDHCGARLFSAEGIQVFVDEATFRAEEPLPRCPSCAGLARPNVLMFGDRDWDGARTADQNERLEAWLATAGEARMAVVECGAGMAVPTVRHTCEALAGRRDATLIRINLREPWVPEGHIGLGMGALDALQAIDQLLGAGGK